MNDSSNPYAAPVSPSRREDVVTEKWSAVRASKWQRLANLLIDNVIIILLLIPLSLVLHVFGPSQFDLTVEGDPAADGMFNLVTIALTLFYYVVMEASFGRTVGKMLTRTKVVNEEGRKPSFGQALGRSFARLIPFEPLSVLFKQNARGWHDLLPSTYVVKIR